MVGDDISDTLALTRADIGSAIGAAKTDTTIETADVVLMGDDSHKLPVFVWLSRSTTGTLKQNIVLTLDVEVVLLAPTFTGQTTMWMTMFADAGTSLLMVGSGLRLLRR